MKKVLLLILVVASSWSYYSKSTKTENGALIDSTVSMENNEPNIGAGNLIQFQCDGRQHCSQMGSYEEAKYFVDNCPDTKMDGDNDGIPCERQFGR